MGFKDVRGIELEDKDHFNHQSKRWRWEKYHAVNLSAALSSKGKRSYWLILIHRETARAASV